MNDATWHQSKHSLARDKIKNIIDKEVKCSSSGDGNLTWKVVEGVYDDELQKIRIEEEKIFFQRGCSPMKNAGGEDELDYNKGFWALWPFTIEEHVAKINEVLTKVNLDRKEKYQRPIKFVSKKELAKFYALILAASIFSHSGFNLWHNDIVKRRKVSFSNNIDFGKYMKLWRFKEIKQYVATVMEDEDSKETDDWYKVKKMVRKFMDKRKENIFASHILVFDESMSAFIPR